MPRLCPLFSILALASLVPLTSFAARPELAPCKVGKGEKQMDALCGTHEVWEDREAKAGRKIGLKVMVIPALSSNPLPDPVFYLPGGPGVAFSEGEWPITQLPLRQERDHVFIDPRGTGKPDRLVCSLADREDGLQVDLGDKFPLDAVRRCREELGKKYDLTRYTMAATVDDFDEVRGWLGYDKVNLVGSSYGTRTAQLYLRRHPESVRTVTLWGAVPMDEPVALSHAANGQRSLDLVLDRCEKDAACRAKFPSPRKDFQAVMDRLSQGPVEVEVVHPETGKPARVRLSREVIADGIRVLLYSSRSGAALPLLLRQAAAGDWQPLGQSVVAAKAGIDELFAWGQFFSMTCAEDIPFIDPAEVPGRTAGSFLGDYRVRQQTAACALWPHARIDPAQREAIRSDLPVLLINGELDVVTPPEFGRRAARYLTQGLRLVDPYASHEDSTDSCTENIANEFIRRGTTQGLDTSCLGRLKPQPYLFELPKEGISPF